LVIKLIRNISGGKSVRAIITNDEIKIVNDENPKLAGTILIDAIPQTGLCPNNCLECFYNSGFFRPLDAPLLPSLKEVGEKIVRVNTGHDSNIQKDLVLKKTKKYKKKFYNTSMPNFDFPGPVVFTCNGRYTNEALLIADEEKLDNLMMVRFRSHPGNTNLLLKCVNYYAVKNAVPVTITFMRYKDKNNIAPDKLHMYKIKRSILNDYWILRDEHKRAILKEARRFFATKEHTISVSPTVISETTKEKLVIAVLASRKDSFMMINTCGTIGSSSLCKYCMRCAEMYNKFVNKTKTKQGS